MTDEKSPTVRSLSEHIKICESKKISLAEYARQNGLNPQRLYQARHQQKASTSQAQKAKRSPQKKQSTIEFLPVAIAPRLQSLTIVAPNGVQITVQQSLSLEEVATLVKALQ